MTVGGERNIFERYISSSQDGVDVYDFRKIGEQNRYGMKRLDGSAELKVSRFLGRHYTVSLLGGVGYMMREETYKDHDYLIRNVLLTPSLGIGARYSGEKFDVELRGCWSHRTVPESRYEVGVDLEKNTEFQHAFTTYAYYANTAELYTAELTVARHFRFGTFGLRGQMLCGRGNRIPEAVYDLSRYEQAVPSALTRALALPETALPAGMDDSTALTRADAAVLVNRLLGRTPDRHDSVWFRVSLFTVF